MIYRISINLYRCEYRIEKTDRYPALVITQNTPIICSSESEWENFEMMCQLGSQNVLTTSGFKIRDP